MERENSGKAKFNRETTAVVASICVFLFLYLPVFVWMGREWAQNYYYTHGFAILPAAVILLYLKKKYFVIMSPNAHGILVIISGLVLYLLSILFWNLFYVASLSMIIVFGGIILYFYGTRGWRHLWFPVFLLFFMVPFPQVIYLAARLQTVTVSFSTWFTSLLGIEVTAVGNQISLPGAQFVVDFRCSGVNSLLALVPVAAVIAFLILDNHKIWKNYLLFSFIIPLAVAGNVLRVSFILIIAEIWNQDVALSYFHSFSSPLFYLLTLGLFFVVIKLLRLKTRTLQEIIDA